MPLLEGVLLLHAVRRFFPNNARHWRVVTPFLHNCHLRCGKDEPHFYKYVALYHNEALQCPIVVPHCDNDERFYIK